MPGTLVATIRMPLRLRARKGECNPQNGSGNGEVGLRYRRPGKATPLTPEMASLLTVAALAAVHLCAGSTASLRGRWRPGALSAAAGIGVGYVFLELMPDLARDQVLIDTRGFLPELENHVYILAMVGLTVFFAVETTSRKSRRRSRLSGDSEFTGNAAFWFSLASFFVLNASIGYAVASPGDEAVEPLWLFALAMGLHFLANDCSLVEHHGERYERTGRWLLAGGLLAGWLIGMVPRFDIPPEALALVLAFIAGGTILNILRNELPDTDRSTDVAAFALGASVYAILALALGSSG